MPGSFSWSFPWRWAWQQQQQWHNWRSQKWWFKAWEAEMAAYENAQWGWKCRTNSKLMELASGKHNLKAHGAAHETNQSWRLIELQMESNVFEAHGAANGNKHSKPMTCKCKHIFKAHGDAYGKHIQSPWGCTWKTNWKPMVLNRKNKFKAHAPPHGAPHFALEGSEMVVVAELVVLFWRTRMPGSSWQGRKQIGAFMGLTLGILTQHV